MRCDAWCFHISFLQAIYAEDDPLITSSPRRAGDEEEVEEMEEVDEAPPAAHAASATGHDVTRVLHERYTGATGIATAVAEAEVTGSHARRSRVGTMDAAAETQAEGDAAEAEAEAEAAAQQATSELAEIALERLVAAATSPKRKRLARPVWNGGAVTAEAAARSLGANSGLHASNEASSVGSSDEQEPAIPPATPPQNSAGTSTASWRAFLATLDAEGQQIAAQVAEDVAAQESEQQQKQQQLGGESGDKSASPRKGRMSTGAGQPPVPSSLIAQRRRRLARSSQANARRRRVVPVNSSHLPQLPKRRTLSAASRRTYTKRLRDRAKNESVSSSAC